MAAGDDSRSVIDLRVWLTVLVQRAWVVLEAVGVCEPNRGVEREGIKVHTAALLDWIPVYPPLQTGIVESVKVIIHPAAAVDFFAGETIDVRSGHAATRGYRVAERIIPVAGHHRLAAVDHVGDVPVPIGVVEIVVGPVAARITIRAPQQAADSSGAFQGAAQVVASGVSNGGCVAAIAFLDYTVPVVNISSYRAHNPGGAVPSVIRPNPQPAASIIAEIRTISRPGTQAHQPVFVIVTVAASGTTFAAASQVAIGIIRVPALFGGQLVVAINAKGRDHTVVGEPIQVPGRIIKVPPVLGIHRAVSHRQLPDLVIYKTV